MERESVLVIPSVPTSILGTSLDSEECRVEVQGGELRVFSSEEKVLHMDLSEVPMVFITPEKEYWKLHIRRQATHVILTATSERQANSWLEYLHQEVLLASSHHSPSQSNGRSKFVAYFKSLHDAFHDDITDESTVPIDLPGPPSKSLLPAPPLNIVILVVGTRGDVQPFIYLGQGLKINGHRVRLATHAEYRKDVINGDLEYYPLAGDPKKLSEYMVKTAGRLLPDLLNQEERLELPEKMAMLRDICFSCFPACTAPDPLDPSSSAFIADAIISNPVSYGHIHCAEALSIPLHIMFPQPWFPTKEFPHPLSNMDFQSSSSLKNFYSYRMIDEFMWLGLGNQINDFRQQVLHLPPIRLGERGDQLLNDNRIPISHMWSPSFVPRCKDWPGHVDVVGEYRIEEGKEPTYVPPQELVSFLNGGDRPLYIGKLFKRVYSVKAGVSRLREYGYRRPFRVGVNHQRSSSHYGYLLIFTASKIIGA